MSLYLLLLPLFVLIDGWLNGKLTLLFRQYVPPIQQGRINTLLHRVMPLLYVMLSVAVVRNWWPGYGAALLIRLAFFDVVLNKTKGDPAFGVGSSAWTDRLLRRLAPGNPQRLSKLIRLAALVLVGVLCLLSTGARAQSHQQLSKPVYHYSYKEAKITRGYMAQQRRKFQRADKKEFADLRRKHNRNQHYFNKHPERKPNKRSIKVFLTPVN